MALYTFTIDGLALVAATAKTVLQLATAAGDRAKIVDWWVEFDGVTATAIPPKVEVGRFDVAVTTATAVAAASHGKFDVADGNPSAIISHSTTTEGAGVITSGMPIHRIPATSGLVLPSSLGRELIVPVSAFWRIRITAAAGVNVTAGVTWEE